MAPVTKIMVAPFERLSDELDKSLKLLVKTLQTRSMKKNHLIEVNEKSPDYSAHLKEARWYFSDQCPSRDVCEALWRAVGLSLFYCI